MKKVTFLAVLFFFSISSTLVKASCPEAIEKKDNKIYLYYNAEDFSEEVYPVVFSLENNVSFTAEKFSLAKAENAIVYTIPEGFSNANFLGEVEIQSAIEGTCNFKNGSAVVMQSGDAPKAEETPEDENNNAANSLLSVCDRWIGSCNTTSTIYRTGNVGIGTNQIYSSSKLSLKGTVELVATGSTGWNTQIRFHKNPSGIRHIIVDNQASGRLLFWPGYGSSAARIAEFHGTVAIGTGGTTPVPTTVGGANVSNYRLFVEGGILTEEVRVRTDWADYVFDKDYNLMPLNQVEDFIKTNGHLHNVPSTQQVEEEGIELGDITKVQQEKIEELFLHLIEMDKRLKELESENAELKAALTEQK